MKRIIIILLVFVFSVIATAQDLEEKIKDEVGTQRFDELVPESIREKVEYSDIDFSYSNVHAGISANTVFNKSIRVLISAFKNEISFIFTLFAFLILSSVFASFSDSFKSSTLGECVKFATSVFLCVFLYNHVLNALEITVSYVNELGNFIKSLIPMLATVICIQGGGTEAVTGSASLIAVIGIVESISARIIIPLVKMLFAFMCAGFVSKLNFSPFTDFVSVVASKTCVIGMSTLSAIMYFQNALSASTDGLALRSAKLIAGNFIPIVGGMISEASSTLLSAAKLVKSTIGVFAFAVLIYMTLFPILSFLVKKVSLKILSAFSSILGIDEGTKIFNSVYGVYNILSALMFSYCTFFVISIAIFIKSGVV